MSIDAARGRNHRRARTFVWILLVTALFIAAGCSKNGAESSKGGPGKGGKGRGGDVPVMVTTVQRKTVPVEVKVIGNVEAYSTINVKAQVGGQLTKVSFQEGDYVSKGGLLFTIDPRPFEATLNQALANAARDEAALGQARANLARDEAQARYQESQANRYAQLFKGGVVSRDQMEQLRSSADAIQQAVAADKAAIESAKAAIGASQAAAENARVQLGYATIRSPIDGRTGNLTAKQGNVVTANNMDLVTINQVQPIYVTFSVPEAQLAAIKHYMVQKKLVVRARPQDDSGSQEETGSLSFIDNLVDSTTGMIKLKGTFANPNRRLWPGQFARVTLQLTMQPNAIVVPNQAVQAGQNGSFVYVVKQDRTVEARNVVTGTRVDQEIVVDSGLEPGEVVVIEGHLRLAPGVRISVRQPGGKPV
jgi:multidrug efflux system membrane fusion protein